MNEDFRMTEEFMEGLKLSGELFVKTAKDLKGEKLEGFMLGFLTQSVLFVRKVRGDEFARRYLADAMADNDSVFDEVEGMIIEKTDG